MAQDGRRAPPKTKYYILTIWLDGAGLGGDPSAEWVENFFNSTVTRDHVQYVRWQLERCPDTNRLHIQAVIQWRQREGVQACHTRLGIPKWAFHAEPITFGFDKCYEYTSKLDTRVGDTAYEWGTFTQPTIGDSGEPVLGAREDIKFAGEFLKRGGTVAELCALRPDLVIKYHKGLTEAAGILAESGRGRKRDVQRRCFVLIGPTGTGKTSGVYDHYADAEVFSPPVRQGQTIWFDGLSGQKVIVFDEFHGEIPFDSMKRFIDPWHNEMAPIKGRHGKLVCDVVFIISNHMPWTWWPKDMSLEHYAEFNRRVTKWVWFGIEEPTGGLGCPRIEWTKAADFDWGVGCHPCPHRR